MLQLLTKVFYVLCVWCCLFKTTFPLMLEVAAQISLCHANCASPDRAVQTINKKSRDHPFGLLPNPSKYSQYCKIGCQFYYVDVPKNTTCKRVCEYYYRHDVTTGYSDSMEQAINECQDGCAIANLVCDEGYYCSGGEMRPCPVGTYRPSIQNFSIWAFDSAEQCLDCPSGRYRSQIKGEEECVNREKCEVSIIFFFFICTYSISEF